MARRLRYSGEAVLTLEQVADQVLGLAPDQHDLVTKVIIPAVTAQAETITGAAIRRAEYVEDWLAGGRRGGWLDIGQADKIVKVQILGGSGDLPEQAYELEQGSLQSRLQLRGVSHLPLRITYEAGTDLEVHPEVRQWLLMQAATLYAQREVLITGTIVARLPESFIDTMLAGITVPPRF